MQSEWDGSEVRFDELSNCIYVILNFDLMSNQFVNRLAHLCLCIFFPISYSITGTHMVTFYCSNVKKS